MLADELLSLLLLSLLLLLLLLLLLISLLLLLLSLLPLSLLLLSLLLLLLFNSETIAGVSMLPSLSGRSRLWRFDDGGTIAGKYGEDDNLFACILPPS